MHVGHPIPMRWVCFIIIPELCMRSPPSDARGKGRYWPHCILRPNTAYSTIHIRQGRLGRARPQKFGLCMVLSRCQSHWHSRSCRVVSGDDTIKRWVVARLSPLFLCSCFSVFLSHVSCRRGSVYRKWVSEWLDGRCDRDYFGVASRGFGMWTLQA